MKGTMSYQVKDSGQRREFDTGAVRDMGGGKGRTDLLPFHALLELAKHFEAGASKYGAENWRRGIPLRVYLDSAVRHLFKFALGMRDERHDLAALWNIACLIETQFMVDRGILPPGLLDLPNYFNADDGGDAHALMAADDADSLAIPEVGEDVEGLNAYLGERFPAPPPESGLNYGWVTDGPVPVKVVKRPALGTYPVDLRPQDREYTRGHADETAARFNAGLSYADDEPARLPSPPLPTPDLLAQVGQYVAPEDAIADHPLFAVSIIDGPDAAEYDEPDADPLAGKAWLIVEPASGLIKSQWFLGSDGSVFFKLGEGYPCEPSKIHTRDTIRRGILSGRLRVVEAGLVE